MAVKNGSETAGRIEAQRVRRGPHDKSGTVSRRTAFCARSSKAAQHGSRPRAAGAEKKSRHLRIVLQDRLQA